MLLSPDKPSADVDFFFYKNVAPVDTPKRTITCDHGIIVVDWPANTGQCLSGHGAEHRFVWCDGVFFLFSLSPAGCERQEQLHSCFPSRHIRESVLQLLEP
ncbi:hypothetical protein GOODEAATRI_013836 [Goodea atripinnis]|uniref:Uncharacterized protein n=1 Tax=Goodea atripinnis TaxID=208336 RepID=A0ABV0MHZ5_9TELE